MRFYKVSCNREQDNAKQAVLSELIHFSKLRARQVAMLIKQLTALTPLAQLKIGFATGDPESFPPQAISQTSHFFLAANAGATSSRIQMGRENTQEENSY